MKKLMMSAVLLAAIFCSCSGRIDGTITQSGNSAGAELRLAAALQPRMAALLRGLSLTLGGNTAPEAPIVDGPAIARSLSLAPGVSSAVLENNGTTAVRGTAVIAKLDEFLAVPGRSSGGAIADNARLLKYDPEGALQIRLDRVTGPQMLAFFSEEVNAYLSALLAPVATGETLTRAEYLRLVMTIYGKPVADDIAASRIQVNLEAPRTISAIKGGTARDRQAQFSIALPDLLVLEQPLEYEISWK
jgi:hypothetical protein